MRILVTNDDGITAPGLVVLEAIAAELSDDVWVVAPAEEQSGAGLSPARRRPCYAFGTSLVTPPM
jgi:5'-nucleotidase